MQAIKLEYGGVTHPGRVRAANEDAFKVDADRGFAMVADGVGGGNGGATASRMAVEIVHAQLAAEVDMLVAAPDVDDETGRARLTTRLRAALDAASREIHTRGLAERELRGMATTAVVVQSWRGWMVVGHVGDSRVYLLRGGTPYQLTEDHSLAQSLLARGAISAAEAENFASNVIVRAVGLQPSVEVDIVAFQIAPDDVFVLCSDGLTDVVSPTEILAEAVVRKPDEAAHVLVERANAAGGPDNISTVLVRATGGPPVRSSIEIHVEMLRHVALFRDLTFQEAARILACAPERRVGLNEVIFHEGEPGDRFFLVVEGMVVISSGGKTLTAVERGGHFGELALITDAPRSAMAQASVPTTLLSIDRETFVWLVQSDHGLAVKLLWGMLGNLATRVKDLSTQLVWGTR